MLSRFMKGIYSLDTDPTKVGEISKAKAILETRGFNLSEAQSTTLAGASQHSVFYATLGFILDEGQKIVIAMNENEDYALEKGTIYFSALHSDIVGKYKSNTKNELEYLTLLVAYFIASNEAAADRYKVAVEKIDNKELGTLALMIDKFFKDIEQRQAVDSYGNFYAIEKAKDRVPTEYRNLETLCKLTSASKTGVEDVDADEFKFFNVTNSAATASTMAASATGEEIEEAEDISLTKDRKFTEEEEELIEENHFRLAEAIQTDAAINLAESIYYARKAGFKRQAIALAGSAGMGKTVNAQMVAELLGLPYVHFICSESTVAKDFAGEIKSIQDKDSGDIVIEDSTIVKALKNGWVCEVQEFSLLQEPAAAGWFNPILDDTCCFYDGNGKKFDVHPDALLIFTYNPNYVENKQVAQATLNRIPIKERATLPEEAAVVDMLLEKTGYKNSKVLANIYHCWREMLNFFQEQSLDEVISIRNLREWIISATTIPKFANKNDWYGAAKATVIYSVGDRDDVEEIDAEFTDTQKAVAEIIKMRFPEIN